MDALFRAVRRAAPARVWSQGVELARADRVSGESADEGEIVLRVAAPGRAVAHTVVLYLEDSEWECDCPNSEDTCAHVAAAIIALTQARKDGHDLPVGGDDSARVHYRFARAGSSVTLERYLVSAAGERKLDSTLGSLLSGGGPAISPERADLDVDRILGVRTRAPLTVDRLANILAVLAGHAHVQLDGDPVRVESEPVVPHAVVERGGPGYRVVIESDPDVVGLVGFGFALCREPGQARGPGAGRETGQENGDPTRQKSGLAIRPLAETDLTGPRLERLPRVYELDKGQLAELQTELLPDLIRRIPVDIRAAEIPAVDREARPRIEFELAQQGDRLDVLALLVYGGDPPTARIDGDRLVYLGNGPVPVRDRAAEKRLVLSLRDQLDLLPGRKATFEGPDRAAFVSRYNRFRGREVQRRGIADPGVETAQLVPRVIVDGDRFDIRFESADDAARTVGAAEVLDAWRSEFDVVVLDGGAWGALPAGWLARHGHLVADLLAARDERGALPLHALPDLARLCDELDRPPPPGLARLEPLFRDFASLPAAALPDDLTATLRPYQRVGVDWLCFLRDAGLGAVLADDMGLGKTLQVLCAISGRSLIVCPTSVLHNWVAEIRRFRPALRPSVYHGPGRQLDPASDVTLTTYAILRLDIETLVQHDWGSVVLDEAQAIKNPDSQVARAAYRLPARFRATLSGTPVENRLDELWSQVHFTNRGLLGGRPDFKRRYGDPVSRGDADAAGRLRRRIRPFLLRRLKRDVAPELPPRTDAVLYCELDDRERAVYDAIRAATQRDVLDRLAAGGSVMAALEALLRLRQAACHSALIPGQQADVSSKIAALIDALEVIAANDHKALVFSQWTSLLDLIEPHLEDAGIPWARLDGSTRDRAGVVASFQDPSGPPVLLISLKAGGFGLNLTAADHVFLCDPWWNPAAEDQAADRAHRIGQDRPVMVYRLVSKDTVEERILALQDRKRSLADAALGQADRAASLTRADLLALLE